MKALIEKIDEMIAIAQEPPTDEQTLKLAKILLWLKQLVIAEQERIIKELIDKQEQITGRLDLISAIKIVKGESR